MAGSLFDAALACLRAASPEDKLAATAQAGEAFAGGLLHVPADAAAPLPITQPGRPPTAPAGRAARIASARPGQ